MSNDTLNFYLPSLAGAVDLVAVVNPLAKVPEVDYDNNVRGIETRSFDCRRVPTILYVPTDYRPTAPGADPHLPDPELIQPSVGDAFVRAIYPIHDLDYRLASGPPLVWTQNINTSSGVYLSTLAQIRQMTTPVPDFLYGWLPGNPYSGNGQAQPASLVAFGNTDPARFQRTFAHELGHLFGLNHNNRRITEVGVDVVDGVGLGRIKPGDLYDVMVAGRLTAEAWVDIPSYTAFRNHPVLSCGSPGAPSPPAQAAHVLVNGVIEKDGRATLRSAYQLNGSTRLTPSDPTGPYELRVEDVRGNVHRLRFAADFDTDSAGEAASTGFSLAVPASAAVARITLTKDGVPLDAIARSANAPRGSFLASPTVLSGRNVLAWSAADPDGDRLTYSLQYSPDGGRSFVALAVDVTDPQVVFDAGYLQPSPHGLLRLLITDGLNTTVVVQTVTMASVGESGGRLAGR